MRFSPNTFLLFLIILLGILACKKEEVDPDICEPDSFDCPTSFTDSRDGQEYNVAKIGCQCWMAENLNYAEAGCCYDDTEENCTLYGRLYSNEELLQGTITSNENPSGIQGICPAGWHVPSLAEFRDLRTYLEMQGPFVEELLKEKIIINGTEVQRFNALYGGEKGRLNIFRGESFQAYFGSTTINIDDNLWVLEVRKRWSGGPSAEFVSPKQIARSCRCVKN